MNREGEEMEDWTSTSSLFKGYSKELFVNSILISVNPFNNRLE
jgi:hypothetical protein